MRIILCLNGKTFRVYKWLSKLCQARHWNVHVLQYRIGRIVLLQTFKQNGLAGMLEDRDIHTVDHISVIVGAIINSRCYEELSKPVTDVSWHYVQLLKLVYYSNGTTG